MWTLVASLFAMALFAIVALMIDSHAMTSIQQAALEQAEVQSGQLLAQFAAAARSDAAAKPYGSGTLITVATLQSDGALPAGFPPGDAFGLQFMAQVGQTQTSSGVTPVIAWTNGRPLNLYGLPVDNSPGALKILQGVELQVAQNALAALQNAGALAGIAVPSASSIQLPFSSQVDLSSAFPNWSIGNPNATVVYMQ
jgi:type II secretory pathway pseudopilin PulG